MAYRYAAARFGAETSALCWQTARYVIRPLLGRTQMYELPVPPRAADVGPYLRASRDLAYAKSRPKVLAKNGWPSQFVRGLFGVGPVRFAFHRGRLTDYIDRSGPDQHIPDPSAPAPRGGRI